MIALDGRCPRCDTEAEQVVDTAAAARTKAATRIPCTRCGTTVVLTKAEVQPNNEEPRTEPLRYTPPNRSRQ